MPRFQPRLAAESIGLQPQDQGTLADAQLLTDKGLTETFFSIQPNGFELFCSRITTRFLRAASPPRGAVLLLLYYRLFIHVNTPFIIGVSTTLVLKSVS